MLNNDKKSLYLILLALNKLIIEFLLAFHFNSLHELFSTRILPYACGSILDNLNKLCIAKCENTYMLSNDSDYTHFFNLSKQLNPSICKAKSQIPTSE
jgi:hypothetical protein